jgi:hypothetical protein
MYYSSETGHEQLPQLNIANGVFYGIKSNEFEPLLFE